MQKHKIAFLVNKIVCLVLKMNVSYVRIHFTLINKNVLSVKIIVINVQLILALNVKKDIILMEYNNVNNVLHHVYNVQANHHAQSVLMDLI